MVERQRATPGKGIRFRCLSWSKSNARWRLTASIVHRIGKLNNAANAIRLDVEGGGIGHGQVRAAGHARNRARRYRHIDRSDLQWHMSSCRWIRRASASIMQ